MARIIILTMVVLFPFSLFGQSINNSRLNTMLIVAAKKGDNQLISKLLRYGGDINACDNEGTILVHAITNKRYSTIDYLIDKGADVAKGTPSSFYNRNMDTTRYYNIYPLNEAISNIDNIRLREKYVQIIVSKGADVNSEGDLKGTPLSLELDSAHRRQPSIKIVKLLIKNGANVNHSPYGIVSPLTIMANNLTCKNKYTIYNKQIFIFLVENNADLFFKEESGKTALDYLEESNESPSDIKKLLEKEMIKQAMSSGK